MFSVMSLLTYITCIIMPVSDCVLVIEIGIVNHKNVHTNYTKWQRVLSEKKVDEMIYYASNFPDCETLYLSGYL